MPFPTLHISFIYHVCSVDDEENGDGAAAHASGCFRATIITFANKRFFPGNCRHVIFKLLGFTFAMITLPIGTYFMTVNTIFKGLWLLSVLFPLQQMFRGLVSLPPFLLCSNTSKIKIIV